VSYFLPAEYVEQPRSFSHDAHRDGEPYWAPWRLAESGRFQHYVYMWAASMVRRGRLASVLDVGCGPGTKLGRWISPLCSDITCLDQQTALEVVKQRVPRAATVECDLEWPPETLGRTFDLIICADVLEHLLDPDPVMELIRASSHASTRILLSTPERRRERGRACMRSDNPEHVREWADDEFAMYVESRGLALIRQRMLPKADEPLLKGRRGERDFRAGRADRSPWACQALLCGVATRGDRS